MGENICVSIKWTKSAVFAGESVECTITFRNVSEVFDGVLSTASRPGRNPLDQWTDGKISNITEGQRPRPYRQQSSSSRIASSQARSPRNPSFKFPVQSQSGLPLTNSSSPRPTGHRRSISIVSLGNDTTEQISSLALRRSNGVNGHIRHASLQVPLRRPSGSPTLSRPGSAFDQTFTLSSPPASQERRSHQTRDMIAEGRPSRGASALSPKENQSNSTDSIKAHTNSDAELSRISAIGDTERRVESMGTEFPATTSLEAQIERTSVGSRAITNGSHANTPRSSVDFYSISNYSNESVASEMIPLHAVARAFKRPGHKRQSSSLGPPSKSRSETLLIGHAQIDGTFVLDGSLVDQSPFEEVKNKRIVSGQGGGGLVRANSTKRDSGILGSFGWGSLGEKFTGILGDSGMSSIKDAKRQISTKSIPILSASQSILFIDLELAPGESRSYRYAHPLPRGIPPTYRGKAIKVNYSLTIGAQRASQSKAQINAKTVEFPFRVLPGIDGNGSILGHDLMSPHTFLSNQATIRCENQAVELMTQERRRGGDSTPGKALHDTAADELVKYMNSMLEAPLTSTSSGLMSPTEEESRWLNPSDDHSKEIAYMVEQAIANNSGRAPASKATNRFDINRNGESVAQILLSRSRFRLGESIAIVVDFTNHNVPCYSVHVALETNERIDPTLALRSKSSIQRVTRRVHFAQHESAIAAERVVFTATVPTSATPAFVTSGISLDWFLKFEFTTPKSDETGEVGDNSGNLQEEIAKDERAVTTAALQNLSCETFTVSVPIQIYGAVAIADEYARVQQLYI